MEEVLSELQARTITAGADLAAVWLEIIPGAKEHLASGWGLSVELQLLPGPPCLVMSIIDQGDKGMRYPVAQRVLGSNESA